MAKVLTKVLISAVAFIGVCNLWQPAFVPPADRHVRSALPMATVAGGASAVLVGAQSAHADAIEDSARKFAEAAYPIMQQVDWVKSPIINKWLTTASSSWSPTKLAMAVDKVLDVALAMDPALVMKAVLAHDKALEAAANDPKLLAPLPEVEEVFISLAQLIGSAGAEKSQAVYDAVTSIGGGSLNQEFYTSVNPGEAAEAYTQFLETVQAVKR